jgi:hypothetical protein
MSMMTSASKKKKKPGYRLTVASPNDNAEALFREVIASLQEGQSYGSKYGCGFFWMLVGVVCLVCVLAYTEIGLGAFVVFLICAILAILYHYAWQEGTGPNWKTDDSGISMSRLTLAEKVEQRIRNEMEQYQTSFRDLLQPALTKAPHQGAITGSSSPTNDNETTPLREIMTETFPGYKMMNYVGCVPESALISYSLAWSLLYDKYTTATDHHPRLERLKELHAKWLEVIGISLQWATHVITDVDQKRVKIRRRAMNTVITGHHDDVEEGGRTDSSQGRLHSSGGAAASDRLSYESRLRSRIDTFKASLQDMRQVDRDDHDFNMKLNFEVLQERKIGPHDISLQRCLLVSGFIAAIGMQGVFIMAVSGAVQEALVVLGGAVLASGIYMLVAVTTANKGFHTLEYLYNVEQLIRKALESEMEQNNKIRGEEEDLIDMTNQLRNTIMEAYYDTLSIHLETELMTYGMLPPTPEYDPTPLFGIIEDKKTTIDDEVYGS